MVYATSNTLGADFSQVYTPPTAGSTYTVGDQPPFALGTILDGTNGTRWVYVQADGAITQYDCVCIDENFQAKKATAALAGAGHTPGFAQFAFADNDYGWVPIRGSGVQVRVVASTSADAQLFVGASGVSAGVLQSASATGTVRLNGVVIITAATSSGTQAELVIATSPFFVSP